MSNKKVLFICHDALRTGAPIFLLNFLKWFHQNSEIPFQILLKDGGELESEFKALAPLTAFNNKSFTGKWWNRLATLMPLFSEFEDRLQKNKLKRNLLKDNIKLVYSNTVTNGEVLRFLSDLKCPIITQVHELEYWIHLSGTKNFDLVRKYTNQFIAVSEAVKQNLVINHDIPDDKVDVVHGFIPIEALKYSSGYKNNMRESLKISSDAFIVGGSGHETWRKGKDLFIQLALNVLRKLVDRPIHFVWIGGRPERAELYKLEHDIRHAGISANIHFVDQVANPIDFYAEFDVFAMTSREDPFPLVNLEAAALGKPIICFDNSGGSPEFVRNDAGFVVPYLDINEMADKIIMLLEDEKLRKQLGENAFEKVRDNYDISVGAKKIQNIIERYL